MIYSDVIKAGMILPKKACYTIRDFHKLREKGFSASVARFILVCSAVHHGTNWAHSLDSLECLQIAEYFNHQNKETRANA